MFLLNRHNDARKDQIIRCDQLVDYIKKLLKESKSEESMEKWMYGTAEFLYSYHTPNTTNYLKKYGVDTEDLVVKNIAESEQKLTKERNESTAVLQEQAENIPTSTDPETAVPTANHEDTPIYHALKQYRYDKSKEEDVKAYFVYNNAQMLAIISAMPSSLEDLKKISGFGDVKCQKYGDKILEIVQMNSL